MRVRGCALIRKEGKILVLVYHYPNGTVYAIPGGNIDEGETIENSVIREFEEELGIQVAIDRLLYVGDMMANQYVAQTVHIVFEGHILLGEPQLNPEQTSANDCIWLEESRLEDVILYPEIKKALLEDGENTSPRYLGDSLTREWA